MQNITLLTYTKLLQELNENKVDTHLLLGNGFNNSLGIKTNYSEIFARMKKACPNYPNMESYLKQEHYDIEKLIGYLKEKIADDKQDFLQDYIEMKVKFDFMKATNEIVQESINKVYKKDENQDIHLLLKNFVNYFTLNYDPFLYLLLLKFKKDEDVTSGALAVQNASLFQEKEFNKNQNNIYKEIKDVREDGSMEISTGKNIFNINLKKTTKTNFEAICREYGKNKNKGWKDKDVSKVCKQIWKEENNQKELIVNDGFQGELFENSKQQNLYFLHGGFQIVKNKRSIQKITAKGNKSFIKKLEESIHDEDRNIVCVLKSESIDKKLQIEKDPYLQKSFNELSKIKGILVVLGSSLAENDNHIFEQINKSLIEKIYISSREEDKEKDYQKARDLFKEKQVALFDYTTISYKK